MEEYKKNSHKALKMSLHKLLLLWGDRSQQEQVHNCWLLLQLPPAWWNKRSGERARRQKDNCRWSSDRTASSAATVITNNVSCVPAVCQASTCRLLDSSSGARRFAPTWWPSKGGPLSFSQWCQVVQLTTWASLNPQLCKSSFLSLMHLILPWAIPHS